MTSAEAPGDPVGIADEAGATQAPPRRWARTLAGVGTAVAACAVAGSMLTEPDGRWYRSLRKPAWQPPAEAFPVVWTTLFGIITAASTATIVELEASGRTEQARVFRRALGANLVLNAGWSALFFRLRNLPLATAGAAVLAWSSADLATRARATGAIKAAGLGAYAAWAGFATVLSGTVARLNSDR